MANTDTTAASARLDHVKHQVLLAPATGHGRFVVILTSSVRGELDRRPVRGRMPAFAEAANDSTNKAAAAIVEPCQINRDPRGDLGLVNCRFIKGLPRRLFRLKVSVTRLEQKNNEEQRRTNN